MIFDRIATESCGCRTDRVTGVYTYFCDEHRALQARAAARERHFRKCLRKRETTFAHRERKKGEEPGNP